jgi:flavin reductase (DIM6/NTAB) family NADH-FMN oxidoreductase RutF
MFRQAMAALPTGVSVLTTKHRGGVRGMTVGSLTSVSLTPPLILVCLRNESPTLETLLRSGRFGLSILAVDQIAIAKTFANPYRDIDTIGFSYLDGIPVVPEAAGWLACRQRHAFAAGDHMIVVGYVTHAESRDGEPLVRHQSRWRHLNPEEENVATPR